MSTSEPLHRAAPRPSPWTPPFTRFFAAQTLSFLGSAMTPVAVSFGILRVTGRIEDLSLVLAANIVPMLALLLFGGVIGDRLPRGRVLVLTHLAAALTQALTALWFFAAAAGIADRRHLVLLMAVTAANGAAAAFTGPALRGIIAELVPAAAIGAANAARTSARSASRLLGPTIGGLLVATAGAGWALAIDAACLALAAALLAGLRTEGRPERTASMLADLREGWAEFVSRRWLWIVSASFFAVNLLIGGIWLVLGPVVAEGSIGASGWGLVLGARAAGLLLAGPIAYRWTPSRPLIWAQLLALPYGGAFLALALAPRLELLLPLALLAGVGSALEAILWETALQQQIPASALSRVASIDMLASFASVPIGQLLAPAIAAAAGVQAAIIVGTGVLVIALLLPLLSRSVRQLPGGPAAHPAPWPGTEARSQPWGSSGTRRSLPTRTAAQP